MQFRSPVNGDQIFLGPEKSMQIQRVLGSDIVMVFDECTPYPASEQAIRDFHGAVAALGARCRDAHARQSRRRCSASSRAACTPACGANPWPGLGEIGFDGYALGGLSVGESEAERIAVLDADRGRNAARTGRAT